MVGCIGTIARNVFSTVRSGARRSVHVAVAALLVVLVVAPLAASPKAAAAEIERLNPDGLTKPRGYSQVVTAAGTRWIHVAGQGGIAADGSVPTGLAEQSRLMFDKVRIALAAAGASPADVVRIVVYVVDLPGTDPGPLYAAIREFFPADAKPASTIVGVSALALPGMKVEIDVTAVR